MWRFDPIVFSNYTDFQERLARFDEMAEKLRPYVSRCYFSFVDIYRKVERRLSGVKTLELYQPEIAELVNFSQELKQLADKYELPLLTCCEEDIGAKAGIKKGHCIDAPYLAGLYPGIKFTDKIKPTRPGCGCYDSKDIGTYDSCKYDCIYCYANK